MTMTYILSRLRIEKHDLLSIYREIGMEGLAAYDEDVVNDEYLGFELTGPHGTHVKDGIVRRVQPDVKMVLDMMAEMQLPTMDSMSPADARMFSDATSAMRPPGPEPAIAPRSTPSAAASARIASANASTTRFSAQSGWSRSKME